MKFKNYSVEMASFVMISKPNFMKIGIDVQAIMFGKAIAINSEKQNESYNNNLQAKSTFLNAEYGDTNNYHCTAYLLDISYINQIFFCLKL
jgi:hypothetical protein